MTTSPIASSRGRVRSTGNIGFVIPSPRDPQPRVRTSLLAPLLVLAGVLVPALASASIPAQPETRVMGFDLAGVARVGLEGDLSRTSRQTYGLWYDELASGSLVAPNRGAIRSGGAYDVGEYTALREVAEPGLQAHHVGQKAVMRRFIPDYDPATGPSVLVPKVGHTIRGPSGIVSRSTEGVSSARDLLARDIRELRRVYPDLPNSQLQKLLELNKQKYGLVKPEAVVNPR